MPQHPTILHREQTLLLIIDVQERLVKAMHQRDSVEKAIMQLQQGMNILHVPMLLTEQYPQGLGSTVETLLTGAHHQAAIAKTTFSCCGEAAFQSTLQKSDRRQIIVTGMETHVCVLQTVLDLLEAGYQVHLPIGTTCSRCDANRDNALIRMQQAGAIITNIESVLFELLHDASAPEFKAISKLIV
ncbi:MAG: isochorismatase family protein [Desulfuromonas sp.]|nr:isochorismatase family protein [Desulfuromonas sp.]